MVMVSSINSAAGLNFNFSWKESSIYHCIAKIVTSVNLVKMNILENAIA